MQSSRPFRLMPAMRSLSATSLMPSVSGSRQDGCLQRVHRTRRRSVETNITRVDSHRWPCRCAARRWSCSISFGTRTKLHRTLPGRASHRTKVCVVSQACAKQSDAFFLLTAYERRDGHVYPLDGVDLPSEGATELLQFVAYKGVDDATFSKTLRAALARR